MYLWVIIATFIAAISAFTLSVRSDIKSLYVEPQAQNVVTKLYVQHRAVRKYLMDRQASGPEHTPEYSPGEIREGDLHGYLPFGFNMDSGLSRFTSLVYCVDITSPGMALLPTDCQSPGGGAPPGIDNCCASKKARTYLISFGCAPDKWTDIDTHKPTAMLLNSMKNTLGFINGFGYVIPRNEVLVPPDFEPFVSTMGVQAQGDSYYHPIPQYIISNQLPGVGSRSFSQICGDGRNQTEYDPENDENEDPSTFGGSCNYCLVYMTPF